MFFHHNQKQVQYLNIKINNIEINRVSQFNGKNIEIIFL